jgi:hypothetical protein
VERQVAGLLLDGGRGAAPGKVRTTLVLVGSRVEDGHRITRATAGSHARAVGRAPARIIVSSVTRGVVGDVVDILIVVGRVLD